MFGWTVDLLAIVIDRGNEIIHFVVCRIGRCFPNLAFILFAVAHENVYKPVVAVQLFCLCCADRYGQSLTERTGGYSNAWQAFVRRRVSLQSRVDATEGRQLRHVEISRPRERSIPNWRDVPVGQEE